MPFGRKVYKEITDEEARKYDHTHKWDGSGELWKCVRCGKSKIALGIWGDSEWREHRRGWERPCQGFTDFWASINGKEILREWTTTRDGMMP